MKAESRTFMCQSTTNFLGFGYNTERSQLPSNVVCFPIADLLVYMGKHISDVQLLILHDIESCYFAKFDILTFIIS